MADLKRRCQLRLWTGPINPCWRYLDSTIVATLADQKASSTVAVEYERLQSPSPPNYHPNGRLSLNLIKQQRGARIDFLQTKIRAK